MEKRAIKTTKRSTTGKNECNRLRVSGKVPGNIIGSGKSVPISLDEKELTRLINSGIRQSTLIEMDTEGESSTVYIKELQRFPETGRFRHVDFYKVTPGKKITTKIAITTTGVAKGSKVGGRFEHLIHELIVKTTPEDIMEVVELDVTNMEIGDAIKVSTLNVPKNWEIIINGDPIIAHVAKTKALIAAEKTDKVEAKPAGKKK